MPTTRTVSAPDSVIFKLYRDGKYVGYQTIQPNSKGKWIATIKAGLLTEYAPDGHEYVYSVVEDPIDGYHSEVVSKAISFTITNTAVVSVSGNKVWDDENDRDGIRPATIVVNLYRDGELVESREVSACDEWMFSFANLLRYAEDGHDFVYTIDETPIEGYTTDIKGDIENGFTITNKHWSESWFDPSGDEDEDEDNPGTDDPGEIVPGGDNPSDDSGESDEGASAEKDAQGTTYQAVYTPDVADASSLSQGANPATGDSPMAALALFATALIGAFAACVARRKAQARF